MSIPPYQDLMLPLLKIVSDDVEHDMPSVIGALAELFHLSEQDRNEMLESGKQTRFDNRAGWAKTYISKAGLLERTGRAKFRITARGLELLSSHPERINNELLNRYAEFQAFRTRRKEQANELPDLLAHTVSPTSATPDEELEHNYNVITSIWEQGLLDKVRQCSPTFFEKLIIDVMVRMGYGGDTIDAGKHLGKTSDEGVDGVIKQDPLGLESIYLQAKRWADNVGRPTVQAFAGSLEGQRARKGVMITTSDYSHEAREYVSNIEKKIVLINGLELVRYMTRFRVGVTVHKTYELHRIAFDYFDET